MAISENGLPASSIPPVDLKAYLENPSSSEAADIVKQIRNACATSGFFQVTGHDDSASLQDRVFAAAKALFALPVHQKRKLSG